VGPGAEGPGEEGEGVEAAGRVAVRHRMVRDSCLEAHHTLALPIVGDSQAICGVDVAVSGLAWAPLAKSVADAGWSSLGRLLVAEGAALPPAVAGVSGWFGSSRLCSGCGAGSGQEAPGGAVLDLHRVWHHRRAGFERRGEHSGATSMVAAGPAETRNARGGGVGEGTCPRGCLSRTHQGGP
jgi:putative transposase